MFMFVLGYGDRGMEIGLQGYSEKRELGNGSTLPKEARLTQEEINSERASAN
jgi:hypothetical protein